MFSRGQQGFTLNLSALSDGILIMYTSLPFTLPGMKLFHTSGTILMSMVQHYFGKMRIAAHFCQNI